MIIWPNSPVFIQVLIIAESRSVELYHRRLKNETSKHLGSKTFLAKLNSKKIEYFKVKSTEKWVNLYHSHTKRNNLHISTVFLEFSENVENSRVVAYRGDRFSNILEELQTDDHIGGILIFLDNILIAITKAKRFQD